VRICVEDGDEIPVVDACGRTGLAAEPLDEASLPIKGCCQDLDRDNAPGQTVMTLTHVGHLPAADPLPKLIGPARTAVVPTAE
jgi:hypothetical protein